MFNKIRYPHNSNSTYCELISLFLADKMQDQLYYYVFIK